jgi:hypothetical protein
MKNLFFFAFILLIAGAISCHHHDHDDDSDTTSPVVTISKPNESANITGALQIVVAVSDNSLHEMSVQVLKDSDNSVLVNEKPKVHDESSYNFDKTFNLSGVTDQTPMTLKVKVEDHGGNVTEKTLKFNYKS